MSRLDDRFLLFTCPLGVFFGAERVAGDGRRHDSSLGGSGGSTCEVLDCSHTVADLDNRGEREVRHSERGGKAGGDG